MFYRIMILLFCSGFSLAQNSIEMFKETPLRQEWMLAASEKAGRDGRIISSPLLAEEEQRWIPTLVPSTVLASLVKAGHNPNPYFSDNLERIPKEQYASPRWYRNRFHLSAFRRDREVIRLFLDGINYRAKIWLNGTRIAGEENVYGAFRQFQFDISAYVRDNDNFLAIEIPPPQPRDFYMGFVDWAPKPPDRNMGIFREVRLRRSDNLVLEVPFVSSEVDLNHPQKARLTIHTSSVNHSGQPKTILLSGKMENRSFQKEILARMFRDQVRWLRNHPSIFVWVAGSDAMPKPSLEQKYLSLLQEDDPTRSLLVSAGAFTSTLTGPSGMKMNGPYEYVPPVYWYQDKKNGGAFGFNSETGPGPQIPPADSIRKMIPAQFLWPPDNNLWNYHSGRKDFNRPTVYLNAMNRRHGNPENLEELGMRAQWMNYEAIRPMFEAFLINRPICTGIVQWMLNSPWPERYWQLWDWYLLPNGAYFGTKKACQPLNLIYNYQNHTVYASNDTREAIQRHSVLLTLYDRNSVKRLQRTLTLDLAEEESRPILTLPNLEGDREIFFLDLKMLNRKRESVAGYFYWLSTQNDVLDWEKTVWYYTPQKEYADFSRIHSMPKAPLNASWKIRRQGKEWIIDLLLKNPSDHILFGVELALTGKKKGETILPVFWSDNYLFFTPGESKSLQARCTAEDLSKEEPKITIRGVNLTRTIVLP